MTQLCPTGQLERLNPAPREGARYSQRTGSRHEEGASVAAPPAHTASSLPAASCHSANHCLSHGHPRRYQPTCCTLSLPLATAVTAYVYLCEGCLTRPLLRAWDCCTHRCISTSALRRPHDSLLNQGTNEANLSVLL